MAAGRRPRLALTEATSGCGRLALAQAISAGAHRRLTSTVLGEYSSWSATRTGSSGCCTCWSAWPPSARRGAHRQDPALKPRPATACRSLSSRPKDKPRGWGCPADIRAATPSMTARSDCATALCPCFLPSAHSVAGGGVSGGGDVQDPPTSFEAGARRSARRALVGEGAGN